MSALWKLANTTKVFSARKCHRRVVVFHAQGMVPHGLGRPFLTAKLFQTRHDFGPNHLFLFVLERLEHFLQLFVFFWFETSSGGVGATPGRHSFFRCCFFFGYKSKVFLI